jgi:hypothetical protein
MSKRKQESTEMFEVIEGETEEGRKWKKTDKWKELAR